MQSTSKKKSTSLFLRGPLVINGTFNIKEIKVLSSRQQTTSRTTFYSIKIVNEGCVDMEETEINKQLPLAFADFQDAVIILYHGTKPSSRPACRPRSHRPWLSVLGSVPSFFGRAKAQTYPTSVAWLAGCSVSSAALSKATA
jgi:hypothetical protein